MIATVDPAVSTEQPVIVVNSQGVIQPTDIKVFDFDESEEDLPISQEFPRWPCQTGRDYKIGFVNFVKKVNLPLNSTDLCVLKRKIKDKINILENSPYANLLAGPCLPIIRPIIEHCYYPKYVHYYWQRINGNFRNKVDLLEGPLRIRDQSDSAFPMQMENFVVRLIFPHALPPLSPEGMFSFAHDLKAQHWLSFVGPLEMLSAMLTYPLVFKGNFRIFFPDFYIGTGEEYSQIPYFAANRQTLSFQSSVVIGLKTFDFCPIMF